MAVVAVAVVVAAGAVVALEHDGGETGCYSRRSTTKPAYPGRSASRVYDWTDVDAQTTSRFGAAVALPDALLEGRYVPQGLAGWPNWDGSGESLLLISAYHDGDADKAADGPSAVFAVVADGPRAGTSAGRMLVDPGHVGGLVVHRGWLYVGSEHEIRGYRLDAVRRALPEGGDDLQPTEYRRSSTHDVANLGSGDGRLWAGRYTKTGSSPLTGYVQTDARAGTLELQADAGILVPPKTQGLTVTADQTISSTSYGRLSRGTLRVVPRGSTAARSYCFRVPSMNEGLTVLDGRLYLLFESAARTYDRGLLRPANVIPEVQSASLTDITSLPAEGPTD
ncbi:hypothetical protein [uncultured Friedmanniella sp.]|uniref:hypothetical protein n=1 Tax=uncultured Friedmanniella sp. TaxID=335381 RepID=UPI0035CB3C1F